MTSDKATASIGAARGPDPFKALGDPIRRRIVEALAFGEQPVEVLAGRLGARYAMVSQHLQILHAAGLVDRRASGRQRLYRLNGAELARLAGWLDAQRQGWERALDRLETFLDRPQ